MPIVNVAHPYGEYSVRHLIDDVLWIEHSDPGTVREGMSTNGYAVLKGQEALLFDTPFSFLMPALRHIAEQGYEPVGLVLSHNHLIGNDDIYPSFKQAFDAPVMLHPIDAAASRALRTGFQFDNPMTSPLIERFGVTVMHFPGQTQGSVMLYRAGDGLLLTGDSAMGTTVGQWQQGIRHLVRPPWKTSADDSELRDAWIAFDKHVAHVAPLHGTPQIAQSDILELMTDLTRHTTTGDLQGGSEGGGGV